MFILVGIEQTGMPLHGHRCQRDAVSQKVNGNDHVTTGEGGLAVHAGVAADADHDAHGGGAVLDDGRIAERRGRGLVVHEYGGRLWELDGNGGSLESSRQVVRL